MPTTRKKVIKTVYKDEDDSEAENAVGDFSDSGSEAEIPEHSSSEDDVEAEDTGDSAEEFSEKSKKKLPQAKRVRKPKFAKEFISKINRQSSALEDEDVAPVLFSVKDLTAQDKLLPSVLNLSESDSSEDESPKAPTKKAGPSAPIVHQAPAPTRFTLSDESDGETKTNTEYKDVFAQNIQDDSEEVAKKTFMELEKHKTKIEETKASILNYTGSKIVQGGESNVKDLLALGEEVLSPSQPGTSKTGRKTKKAKDDSDSEMEDWEEVKDAKLIPQQGIQLVVDFPDAACRKAKKVDVEMMMRRKINRVKKEYQVYMHKVHVLCWLGHGNYVSRVLNDQDILAAALSLVPSKECYPGERVDMKYAEQITTWFKDKLTLKQDKNEDKFRPKAPPLKDILLTQMKSRVVTSKKYMVFIFVSMLRALGLQCRVMFNFVTLPIRPPTSELCSLSTKQKEAKKETDDKKTVKTYEKSQDKSKKTVTSSKCKSKGKMAQMDGTYDSSGESDIDNIMQLDGNDDAPTARTRRTRTCKKPATPTIAENDDVSPPKKAKISPVPKKKEKEMDSKQSKIDSKSKINGETEKDVTPRRQRACRKSSVRSDKSTETKSAANVSDKIQSEVISKTEINGKTTKNEPAKRQRGSRKSTVISEEKSTDTKSTKNNTKKSQDKTDSSEQTTKVEAMDVDLPEVKKVPSPRKTRTNSKAGSEKKADETKGTKNNAKESEVTKKATGQETTKVKHMDIDVEEIKKVPSPRKTRTSSTTNTRQSKVEALDTKKVEAPKITITDVKNETSSKYFNTDKPSTSKNLSLRKRSSTANPPTPSTTEKADDKPTLSKTRTKSAPGTPLETSQYFKTEVPSAKKRQNSPRLTKKEIAEEDKQRVSHRDIVAKSKAKPSNDITSDLVKIIKKRVKEAKEDSKKGIVKGKVKQESDEDSDYLPEEAPARKSESDDDFKPITTKISPRPSNSRVTAIKKTQKNIDRRVLSSEEHEIPVPNNRCDVWCEIFVEELEQWIAIDVIKGKVHCTSDIYTHCTHPVCYVVGWDNNNYLKDLTRRYVPHWNTVTRKQRAEPAWWDHAIKPWLGPKTAKDREEDEQLNRMQLEAPLPKSIGEYKNHPLYALKRHLLKFEAIYPPDAATLGFVRGEPVYARECVYVCRSRDTWLKEAKVVRLGEEPYKVVKARPKWDRATPGFVSGEPVYARECVYVCRSRDTWLKEAKVVRLGEEPYKVFKARPKWDRATLGFACGEPVYAREYVYVCRSRETWLKEAKVVRLGEEPYKVIKARPKWDRPTLGFVRNEPVYARECVYVCRSRDTRLKEAKLVRLGEELYKVVKARPKWDRLSNKLITDKPLEVFGPWQVQDYEPPTAENGVVPRNAYGNVELFKDCMLPKGTVHINDYIKCEYSDYIGIVPRNAYGNVELFKDCMLPKGTVHIKLPGLNRVAKKLNIDCAPAMTGFDFNGGWSHPVYDGFVVCKEFEEIVTDAWVKEFEEIVTDAWVKVGYNPSLTAVMTGFDFNGGWSHPVYDGFVVCKEFEEIVTDAWVKVGITPHWLWFEPGVTSTAAGRTRSTTGL
ncbi:rad4 beta-hairpin domain 3 domain-containing protein [Phthorimaea operculella]|nr:rad4 beta-hairpin domain 3 domain-containing protein [Phthorimaea operculella]